MAGSMKVPVVRDAVNYGEDDWLEIEIEGQVQPDLVRMFDTAAARAAALSGDPGVLIHQTLARFPAGDYDVRVRGVDALGNVGDWSAVTTIPHRPTPETPSALAIVGDELVGEWSDV